MDFEDLPDAPGYAIIGPDEVLVLLRLLRGDIPHPADTMDMERKLEDAELQWKKHQEQLRKESRENKPKYHTGTGYAA